MAKKCSKSKEAQYNNYKAKDKARTNAERNLARHLKKHPNDAQSAARVGQLARKRKTPTSRLGWVSETLKESMGSTPLRRGLCRQWAMALAS